MKHGAVFTAALLPLSFLGYWAARYFSNDQLISPDLLLPLCGLFWFVGLAMIFVRSWLQHTKLAAGTGDAGYYQTPETRAYLKKIIRWRYLSRFLASFAVLTVSLLLVLYLILVIKSSRVWYAGDLLFPLLSALNELSPFAFLAVWVGGAALLLFHQWRQIASDVVGLIDSIEQMHTEELNKEISVPKNLIEVRPVLQEIANDSLKSKRAAKEAEQRKNELIVYLAHDLKTPLTSVIGYLSLLDEAPEMPTKQKAKYTHIALDKAVRLETLINQFFEISRYNLHEMVLESEYFDLRFLLIQITEELYPLLESQNKTITIQSPETVFLEGDAGKLARVFNNILRNAVAYSHHGSSILIEVLREEETTTITFTNHGKTIPAHRLQSIFDKFYRLDESRTSNTGGAGLGLAIAKEIVLLHKGSISAESREGTSIFTVVLP